MKEFWVIIQTVFTGLGGWIGYYLGGCDGLIYALILFVIVDYIGERQTGNTYQSKCNGHSRDKGCRDKN